MDLNALWTSLQSSLGAHTPQLMGALLILVVGWMLATVARAATIRVLGMAGLNQRFAALTGLNTQVERGVGIAVFWLILLFVLVAVFNALNLVMVSGPLSNMLDQLIGFAPQLLGGLVLTAVALLVATVVRAVVQKVLDRTSLDDKLSEQAHMPPMGQHVAGALYWIIILLFLPAILGALGLTGLLEPLSAMVADVLAFLPNLVAAGLIGGIGWVVATVLRHLVSNLARTAGVDRWLQNSEDDNNAVQLSSVVGMAVFVVVFVPALIAALDALGVEAVSGPATQMLAIIMQALPHMVAAALIVVVTWFVARFASRLVAALLSSVGFDQLPQRMGAEHLFGSKKPSALVGGLVLFFAMLFAVVEAAGQLGFGQVSELVAQFIEFGAQILLGSVVLAVGFWLANLAASAIDRAAGPNSGGLSKVARFAILGLVIAMGLRAMGIADDIVNLAFGLTLGAVAVAVALSFGLGGREAAGKLMEHWLSKFRQDK
jgi:hypothetical protein